MTGARCADAPARSARSRLQQTSLHSRKPARKHEFKCWQHCSTLHWALRCHTCQQHSNACRQSTTVIGQACGRAGCVPIQQLMFCVSESQLIRARLAPSHAQTQLGISGAQTQFGRAMQLLPCSKAICAANRVHAVSYQHSNIEKTHTSCLLYCSTHSRYTQQSCQWLAPSQHPMHRDSVCFYKNVSLAGRCEHELCPPALNWCQICSTAQAR